MLPIVYVSKVKKEIDSYIDHFIKNYAFKNHLVFYIHPADKEITIDQIRSVKKITSFSYSEKILFVLYDFHLTSVEAQNAFLKTLEEKSDDVQFILVCDNEFSVLPTILSRVKINSPLKKKRDASLKDKNIETLIDLIRSKDTAALAEASVTGIKKEAAIILIDGIIVHFHRELLKIYTGTNILKKALLFRSLLTHNNINAQLTLDNLLIFISKQIKIKS